MKSILIDEKQMVQNKNQLKQQVWLEARYPNQTRCVNFSKFERTKSHNISIYFYYASVRKVNCKLGKFS